MIIIYSQATDADQPVDDEGKGDVQLCSVQAGLIKVIIQLIKSYYFNNNIYVFKVDQSTHIDNIDQLDHFIITGSIIIYSQATDADQPDDNEVKGDVQLGSVKAGMIKVIIHVIKI